MLGRCCPGSSEKQAGVSGMGRLWVLLPSCLSLSESGHSELGADWIIIMTTHTHTHTHTLRESEQSAGNTDLLSRRYTYAHIHTVGGDV